MSSGTNKTIYSIGYGTRSVEEIAYILHAYTIGAVIDVRADPRDAAMPQWNKTALEKTLPVYNLAYMWMGKELGVPTGQTDLDGIERTPLYASASPNYRGSSPVTPKVHLICRMSLFFQSKLTPPPAFANALLHVPCAILIGRCATSSPTAHLVKVLWWRGWHFTLAFCVG